MILKCLACPENQTCCYETYDCDLIQIFFLRHADVYVYDDVYVCGDADLNVCHYWQDLDLLRQSDRFYEFLFLCYVNWFYET